jgi:hypothetical protein
MYLEEAMKLVNYKEKPPGSRQDLKIFTRMTYSLLKEHGKDWLWKHRRELRAEWEYVQTLL